jgi:hypothetical protein
MAFSAVAFKTGTQLNNTSMRGVQQANYLFGVLRECPHAPLHSDLYREHCFEFSVIIVDESHRAKSETTLLNRAIRSLDYQVAFLLTGAPIFNSWRDLAGQLMLLPDGGPFENLEHLAELIQLGRADLLETANKVQYAWAAQEVIVEHSSTTCWRP